jgi:hypothetical protein
MDTPGQARYLITTAPSTPPRHRWARVRVRGEITESHTYETVGKSQTGLIVNSPMIWDLHPQLWHRGPGYRCDLFLAEIYLCQGCSCDKNRRGIGKSQSIWTHFKMETIGDAGLCGARGGEQVTFELGATGGVLAAIQPCRSKFVRMFQLLQCRAVPAID